MRTAQRPYKRYPAYKESGLDWLDQVPTSWLLQRLRFVVSSNPSKTEIQRLPPNTAVSFVPMECIGEFGGLTLDVEKTIADSIDGFTYFRDDDVLVAKITPCFENGKGALAAKLVNGIGFGTTELHVLRAHPAIDARFLFYISISDHFRRLGASTMYGAGGQRRVPGDFIRDLVHPLPSIDEQRCITSFLDRKTAKIDALVTKKKRMVERLQEKRGALITQAVTKGVDPSAPMKNSGVEWIGQIPRHWQVKRLWHLTPVDRPIMYGIVLPGPNVEDGVPIVKGGDVAEGRLRLDRLNRTTREIESSYARSRLRGGDLVFAIRGSIGEVATVPVELTGANLTQDAARIAFTDDTDGAWLMYVNQSSPVFSQLEAGALGATIKGINIRDLKRALIPVPPRDEQLAISTFLAQQTTRIDSIISAMSSAIDRLDELRTSIISAAVTGKIDVREEVS